MRKLKFWNINIPVLKSDIKCDIKMLMNFFFSEICFFYFLENIISHLSCKSFT